MMISPLRIVASMTTTAARVNLIEPVVDSVLAQSQPIERLVLNLPTTIKDIPLWLWQRPGVQLRRGKDYGPITKVADTLWSYRHSPDMHVWSVDDDFVYPPSRLQRLATYAQTVEPGVVSVVGGEWWAQYMSFQGYGSVLYPPQCVGEDFMKFVTSVNSNRAARANDDVTMSYYFKRRGALVHICPGPFEPAVELPHSRNDDALHRNTWPELFEQSLAFMRGLH